MVVAVAAFLGFLVWGLVQKGDSGLAIGETFPVATLPKLGEPGEASVADYRGEWVLLNVWASWCGPCKAESPALEKFEREYRDRITVVGIDTKDLSGDALAFLREYDVNYDQLRDASGDYADGELKTTGVPESFLIDPDGNLAGHFPGPFASVEAIERFAEPAIEATASQTKP